MFTRLSNMQTTTTLSNLIYRLRLPLTIVTICGAILQSVSAQQAVPAPSGIPHRTRLIHAGWERPDSGDMVRHIREMEDTPYDGIILMLHGRDDQGKQVILQRPFENTSWKREWFQKNVDDLKSVRSERITENFVRISANPGNVDWFDDEGWAAIVEKMRIAAWIAKEGGLKGICFDPEPYSRPYWQMNYQSQPNKDQYSFEEYQAKARQRGREVMQAVASEYPDMIFFTFFMNSQSMGHTPETLIRAGYNLYPAFIDGWLDVCPPEMVFIDGNENSYHYSGELAYLRAANSMRNTSLQLVAPENRAKYRAQVRVGFALYLDAYVNKEGSQWYHGPLHGSRTLHLFANAEHAATIADEYVWTWGEKYRWWPTRTRQVNPESWDEAIPGAYAALLAAFNPAQLRPILEQRFEMMPSSQKVNRVQNSGFAADKLSSNGIPLNWNPWKNRRVTEGTVTFDAQTDRQNNRNSGSARLAGINVRGSFGQDFEVIGGQYYKVSGWMKSQGEGFSGIRVRWKDEKDQWLDTSKDVSLEPVGEHSSTDWQKLETIVIVPGSATTLVLLLGATNQPSPEKDVVWFDDLELIQITD